MVLLPYYCTVGDSFLNVRHHTGLWEMLWSAFVIFFFFFYILLTKRLTNWNKLTD